MRIGSRQLVRSPLRTRPRRKPRVIPSPLEGDRVPIIPAQAGLQEETSQNLLSRTWVNKAVAFCTLARVPDTSPLQTQGGAAQRSKQGTPVDARLLQRLLGGITTR